MAKEHLKFLFATCVSRLSTACPCSNQQKIGRIKFHQGVFRCHFYKFTRLFFASENAKYQKRLYSRLGLCGRALQTIRTATGSVCYTNGPSFCLQCTGGFGHKKRRPHLQETWRCLNFWFFTILKHEEL